MSAQSVDSLAIDIANLRNLLENQIGGLIQIASAGHQNSATALNALNGLQNSIDGLSQRIDGSMMRLAHLDQTSTGQALDAMQVQMQLMLRVAHRQAADLANPKPSPAPVLAPQPFDLAAQLAALQDAAPLNFARWKLLFDAGAAQYKNLSASDLSTSANYAALLFSLFVQAHAEGRVLDVGCGPLAVPAYLSGIAHRRIAAIDPLGADQPHPFVFAQSAAEYLPWPDGSFETVVAATSIDHVYLLDQSLAEMARVLTPGGRLLLWTGIFAETAPYDPYTAEISPPDAYHLFHPGENWFPDYVARYFRLDERLEYMRIGYSGAFLCYTKV